MAGVTAPTDFFDPLGFSTDLSSLVIVRLPICPVEPLDSFVLVRPDPFSWSVLAVTLPSEGSHPKVSSVSRQEHVEQLGLEPVVDAGVVQLCHPGLVVGTDNVCVVSGHALSSLEPEASTAGPVLLQDP